MQPKKLIVRLLETAAMFALAMFLIRLGIGYLISVKWALIVLTVLTIGGVVGFRLWKQKSKEQW